jgi:hypothetical protein
MNSEGKKLWRVVLAGPAQRSLERIPPRDRARIRSAIDEMEIDPFSGDIKHLKGQGLLRRRVGSGEFFTGWSVLKALCGSWRSSVAHPRPIEVFADHSAPCISDKFFQK